MPHRPAYTGRMKEAMNDVFGWASLVGILAVGPMMLIIGLWHALSRKPVEEKYRGSGRGGFGGVFDAVWSPSAHEAGMERDRQTQRTAPAPAPGDPPWAISEDRITIDVPPEEGTARTDAPPGSGRRRRMRG